MKAYFSQLAAAPFLHHWKETLFFEIASKLGAGHASTLIICSQRDLRRVALLFLIISLS